MMSLAFRSEAFIFELNAGPLRLLFTPTGGGLMSTQATLAHHLQAFTEGVDSILSDYTEDSVLFTPEGPVQGLQGIRSVFEGFLASSPPELIQALRVTRQDVVGEVAYILWNAPPFIPSATDTFLIRDGKILVQSFAVLASVPPSGEGVSAPQPVPLA